MFLLAVVATRSTDHIQQFFPQVAAIIDKQVAQQGTTNPFNIVESFPSVPAKAAQDVVLLEKLCMGEGMGDDPVAPRLHHPSQHIRSFQSLTAEGKKMRTMHPATLNENLLIRLQTVATCIFKKAMFSHVRLIKCCRNTSVRVIISS